jgi:DNA-directed RNA polymerase subunit omega
MARISSERAVAAVGNRYDLIMIAAQRTRELMNGQRPLVARNGNSHAVTALREIEEGKIRPLTYLVRYVNQNNH